MVEQTLSLDSIFGALADPTRRDILQRLLSGQLSVGQIAAPYDVSLAAISKHLKVMERAHLIAKRRQGKSYLVTAAPDALRTADEYLDLYRRMWETRLDALETYLQTPKEESHDR